MTRGHGDSYGSRPWLGRPAAARARFFHSQDGAALVETAVSMSVFLAVMFGLIAFCYALYGYNFVSNAARLATRYAVVRGANSCTIAPSFPDCDMPNTTAASALQTFVRNLGYPGLNGNNVTVTATWLNPLTQYDPTTGDTTVIGWNTTCVPTTADPVCNVAGDAVHVVVTYTLPLNIPFWRNGSLTVSSSSQMMINE